MTTAAHMIIPNFFMALIFSLNMNFRCFYVQHRAILQSRLSELVRGFMLHCFYTEEFFADDLDPFVALQRPAAMDNQITERRQ